MDFFSSFFVVAATASAADESASTGEPSDDVRDEAADAPAPADPRSIADGRRLLAGPPRDALAFLISALTSPFLVCAVAAGALASALADSWGDILVWGLMASIFAGVLPFLIVLAFLLKGRVSDMHVALKEQRWVPLGAAILSGVLGLIGLRAVNAPVPLLALTAGYVANAVVFITVSWFWKASLHSGVYAGAFAACAMVVSPWWWLGLLGLPGIIWARSQRGRHTVPQGIVGASIALVVLAATYIAVMAKWGV